MNIYITIGVIDWKRNEEENEHFNQKTVICIQLSNYENHLRRQKTYLLKVVMLLYYWAIVNEIVKMFFAVVYY